MSNLDNTSLAYLDEPKPGYLNIHYSPNESTEIVENPPRFTWLPVVEDEARYCLRVSTSESFADNQTTLYKNLDLNFLTPDDTFAPGDYYWSYAVWSEADDGNVTEWSDTRRFTVPEGLPEVPLVSRATRYNNASTARPRLWLNTAQITALRKAVTEDDSYIGWSKFLEKSALPWMDRKVMSEPKPYENNVRTAPVWRQTYIDCQELIYAIRHLAISGHVLENDAHLERSKQWLMEAATWDPEGPTSRAYTDEWAFRVAVALAWGYDWLHEMLSEDEEKLVRQALMDRTRQVADHVVVNAKIHLFPYDSHAVRSVSAVLIPACIALWDKEEEAKEWLDYSIEFLSTVYSPWADSDGGWAEGPHYWMTGMAYFTEAANLLKSYMGIDLYQRPFLKKTANFPLYTKAPSTRRATFGDDSTMGDLVCLKVGYNVRQFAGVTGNGAYQWYFDEVNRNDPGTEMAFYNYGWWDLNFDDLMYRHDFPETPSEVPTDLPRLCWFKGIGWVGIQHALSNPDKHIHFVMKSSRFGSISHSHGDQNAFCMSAYGEDLAIQSGHYVAFNSSMHKTWRRQTRSKNAILINGVGQYADNDKSKAIRSGGSIVVAEERDDHIYIKADATPAYQIMNEAVRQVTREVYFVQNSYFVIVDSVDADEPVELNWLLHANNPYSLGNNSFRNTGEKAGFYGQFVWSEGGNPTLSQTTGYPGVDESEFKGLDISTHLNAKFPKASRHRIATLLVPYRKSEPKRIFNFLDDQGYDCVLYFTDADENSFRLSIQKLAQA